MKKLKKWVPHNYQLEALSFILTKPCSGLFLDPGLGKTSISLSAIRMLIDSGQSKGVLVIAPLRVTYSTWPIEIKKWSNFNQLTHTILHGPTKQSLWGDQKNIYLVNGEGLKWLHDELLDGLRNGKECPFDTLIIDESTKFKSHESKRWGYLANMAPLFKRKHIMTGTPAPRGLLDLWAQIFLLDKGDCLGKSFYKFRGTYFEADDWNKYSWRIRDFAEREIHAAVAPLILDMSASKYLDIPDKLINDIRITLPDKAHEHYKTMERDFFIELDNTEVSAQATATAGMKCHQIANGQVYEDIPDDLMDDERRVFVRNRKSLFVHKAKVDALVNLVDELAGKPLLIAYHYKHDLAAIRKALGDVPYIGSGVTPDQTNKLCERWNKGQIPVLLGHPMSMSHGLNLQTGGLDICWFSLTWNLEDYLQFNARIHRQGVNGKVRIHRLVAAETIDEAMLSRLNDKAATQHGLREAIRAYRVG